MKNIQVKNLYTDQSIDFGKVKFTSVWPEKNWLVNRIDCTNSSNNSNCSTLASKNASVLGISTNNSGLNDFSEMGLLTYGTFDVLFTGDGDQKIQDDILKIYNNQIDPDQIGVDLEVMKVPHHGSKTALSNEFLNKFTPKLAIISVGKNNSYNHPNPQLLEKFTNLNIPVKRTDREGTIEIISDGINWSVLKSRL